MSEGRVRRGKPVWERGRLGRFWGGLRDYATTAWWGLVSPRLSESSSLVIVQAVILREAPRRQVLLSIRSDLFGWELPGGTVQPREDPERAVVREVSEETGFDVDVRAHVGDWHRTGFRPHTARVYRCDVLGGTLRPSHETPRVAWFDIDRLPSELFSWYEEPLRASLTPEGWPVEGHDHQGIATIWEAMKIDLSMRWRGLP